MQKVSRKQIDLFFGNKKLAVAGASRNPQKFGHHVVRDLSKNGYTIVPVNPHADKILDIPCLNTVADLPNDIDSLLITTPKHETDAVLRAAIDKGIKNIWVQQSAETENTLRVAEEYQKEIITGKCIFMFAEPVTSIHKFHRTLVKLFGRLPK